MQNGFVKSFNGRIHDDQRHAHAHAAYPHARHVGPEPAQLVQKRPGEQLRPAPDKAVGADDAASLHQGRALRHKENGEKRPDQRIETLLDKPRLGDREDPSNATPT